MIAGVAASSEPPASMPLTHRSFSSDQRATTRGAILADRPRAPPKELLEGAAEVHLDPMLAQALDERRATQNFAVDQHPVAIEDDQIVARYGTHRRQRRLP